MKRIYPVEVKKKSRRANTARAVAVCRYEIYILAQVKYDMCQWIGLGYWGNQFNRKSNQEFITLDDAVKHMITSNGSVEIYTDVTQEELGGLLLTGVEG